MSKIKLGFTVIAVLLASACSDNSQSAASSYSPEFSSVQSEEIFQVLLAEYYYQQQNYQKSSQIYNNLLTVHADANVAKRATELAIKTDDYDQALIAAERWKLLEPDVGDVDQFLVLLYQEKKNYVAAAKILADLVAAYPSKKAKPLDVAVALLEQQKEVSHAYYTFEYYIQNHTDKTDDITRASYYLSLFAMRGQMYEEVVKATEDLSRIKDKELQRKTALLRVKALTALDKPEKALQALKKLIAEAANPETRQSYARIMASLGQADKAVDLLEQAYEKHTDKAELLLDMITISLNDEKYEKSLTFIDKLQAIKGQEDKAHYYRGLVFETQNKYPKALEEYNAIDEENQSVQIFTRIVTSLKEVKGLDSALAYLHKKQEKSQGDAQLQGELYLIESEMLRQQDQFKQALEMNKKAAKLLPLDLDILYSQALLYEDIHQIKKSEETLQGILYVDSNHSAALNALGYMLSVHTSRLDEAYKYIKKAYDLKPNDPAIIDSLGWVSYRKGDLQGAERYLRIAYQKLQDPEVASHLVEVLSKQGQQEEATKLLDEMLQKHPDNKRLIETKAIIIKK